MAKFESPEDAAAKRARITAGLKKAAKELANFEAAIAAGGASPTLLSGLRERERERRQRDLQAELAALDAAPAVRESTSALKREALKLLDEWRGLLGRNVATSRQLLRKRLGGEQRFVFYPKRRGAGAGCYELGVRPTLDGLLERLPLLKKAVASPTGFEPVFWP